MKNIISLLLIFSIVTASALDIAVHGKPVDCSIVIAENAEKPYESAAKEL